MKKKILGLLSLALLTLLTGTSAFAAEEPELPTFAPQPYYMAFSGTVAEINPYYNTDGAVTTKLFVLVQNAEGGLMNFVVDDETVMLTAEELSVGAAVTGFYLGNMPMIMIYPPQTHAALLAVKLPDGQTVKAALFDENLVSDDNDLKLNIGPDTAIVLQNGEPAPADTELANRRLAVFYTVSTRSIPAQTTPLKVIVLDEEAAAEQTPAEPIGVEEFVTDGMPLSVEGVLLLDAPPVYVREDGTVMVPLRAVAEALGLNVGWQAESRSVILDGTIKVTVGQDGVELHNGVTYMPLGQFRQLLNINNAYVFEGLVEINNGEIML